MSADIDPGQRVTLELGVLGVAFQGELEQYVETALARRIVAGGLLRIQELALSDEAGPEEPDLSTPFIEQLEGVHGPEQLEDLIETAYYRLRACADPELRRDDEQHPATGTVRAIVPGDVKPGNQGLVSIMYGRNTSDVPTVEILLSGDSQYPYNAVEPAEGQRYRFYGLAVSRIPSELPDSAGQDAYLLKSIVERRIRGSQTSHPQHKGLAKYDGETEDWEIPRDGNIWKIAQLVFSKFDRAIDWLENVREIGPAGSGLTFTDVRSAGLTDAESGELVEGWYEVMQAEHQDVLAAASTRRNHTGM